MSEVIEVRKIEILHELWHRGELSYKLDSLQQRIRDTVTNLPHEKKICILSSRQIGKSFFSVVYALEFLIRNPGKIVRIIAPTLKQCHDIIEDNLNPIMLDCPSGFITPKKVEYRWLLNNGGSLRIGALERQYVDANRGGNASLVIYEECGFVAADDFMYGVNSVLGPQLLRSNGRELFVSSPSEDPDHPLHTSILPECQDAGTAFVYTIYDSPSITQDQIESAARRCGGYETEAFQREYMARIIRPVSKVVIPAFDQERHVESFRLPTYCFWTVTLDWGGVRDLTVALLHTYDYNTGIHLICDEMKWEANTSTNEIVRGLRQYDSSHQIAARWADVPGQIQVDLEHEHHYQVQVPPKTDWKATVQNLNAIFANNNIRIHPRCTFLIKTLRGALFNKQRIDFERSSDLGHCDAIAALMYAVRTQDISNPYVVQAKGSDNYFGSALKNDGEVQFAQAINPKRFGNFR